MQQRGKNERILKTSFGKNLFLGIFRSLAYSLLLGVFLLSSGSVLFSPVTVLAVTEAKAKATTVSVPTTITLKPLEKKVITVTYKNIGDVVWNQTGKEYVSLYTDPSTFKSPMYAIAWKAKNQPAFMKEKTVKKDGIATFIFTVEAPKKEGKYIEKYKLARENTEWIAGSFITVTFDVRATATPTLSGALIIKSADVGEVSGGQVIPLSLGFKNTGTGVWKHTTLQIAETSRNTVTASDIYDASWSDDHTIVATDTEYKTGNLALLSANIRAPQRMGSHLISLQLYNEGKIIPGAVIDIPFVVNTTTTTDSGTTTPTAEVVPTWKGVIQPRMRVGITQTENAIITVSGDYTLFDGTGIELFPVINGEQITIMFDPGTLGQQAMYRGQLYSTTTHFRLEPKDPLVGMFILENFESRPNWNKNINDNVFRGAFELQRNEKGYVWVLNDLPLEQYISGIAEASNPWPEEFHKALAVATRSYANYYIQVGGKHAGSSYYLNASSLDQVYRGYNAESRNPRYVQAVNDTRGVNVLYNGQVAFTPFFSRSSGVTKSHKQVYGRDVPYLMPRTAEYDKKVGKSLWGHGVGMPMTDAAFRAEDGYGYEEILKAYYTDVSIERIYE